MNAVDAELLLGFLGEHANVSSPLVGAIYEGLSQRIQRGDFDIKEKK